MLSAKIVQARAEITMSEPEKSAFRKKFDELSDRFRNPKARKTQINIWYVVAAVLGFMLVQSFYQASKQYTTIPYSQFQSLLDQNKIDKVWIEQNTIQGTLKSGEGGLKQFVTTRVTPDLATVLDKHHVTYSGEIPSTWLTDILSWVLPAATLRALDVRHPALRPRRWRRPHGDRQEPRQSLRRERTPR